jgi:glutaconate CoA-transferase subunit A
MDKRMGMSEAAHLVKESGARVAFGGVTLYRRPMAYCLSLLQRFQQSGAPNHLHLVNFTAGLESDLLVGAGMVETIRTCYFGLEAFGLAPQFTQAASDGSITIIEETEASLASGLRASMAGVGFIPSVAWIGTDLLKLRPDVKTVVDPYSGEELTAFPAIEVDTAIIHALKADLEGNAQIGGNQGVDVELALVADTVVVTAEEIVPSLSKADVIAPVVDAVVHSPRGAWPTSCHPEYPFDGQALLEYIGAESTEDYNNLIQEWSSGPNIQPH